VAKASSSGTVGMASSSGTVGMASSSGTVGMASSSGTVERLATKMVGMSPCNSGYAGLKAEGYVEGPLPRSAVWKWASAQSNPHAFH
jgi:hypothetical protein